MNERIKRLIKPMILVAIAIFAGCWFVKKPVSIDDYSSYIGYAISGVGIFFLVYEKFLWRIIPWNRPPVLKKNYKGTLSFVYNGIPGKKDIFIAVKQTWLSVEITTKTDINASHTITGTVVKENGADFLYYTYITDPSASCQSKNPIQHGTCRMALSHDNTNLTGKYWTTSQTVGDIEWKVVSKEENKS